MNAISLWQPWASLIVMGVKRVTTMDWHTFKRGKLAIHASKKWSNVQRDFCCTEPFLSCLRGAGCVYDGDPEVWKYVLPRGALLGEVRLLDCLPADAALDGQETAYVPPDGREPGRLTVSKVERLLGDYTPGRWAFVLADARRYPRPIRCQGALAIFSVPDLEAS